MQPVRQHYFLLQLVACGTLVAPIAGCGGSGNNNTSTPVAPTSPAAPSLTASNSFYVTSTPLIAFLPDTLTPSILQFPRTASSSTAPASTTTGPVGLNFDVVTVDALGNVYAGGRLYSGSAQSGSEIVEYSAGATGTAKPTRTITNGLSTLTTTGISSMATDSANNLYVATDVAVGSGPAGRVYSGIAIYPPGATAPSRFIAGDATGILSPTQIAVDSVGNVYVASTGVESGGSIQVFNAAATGNAAPLRTISGVATTIYNTRGVAADAAGNVYVSTITLAPLNGPYLGGTPTIAEFAPTADGNVAPINVISSSGTNLGGLGNLRLDGSGNIYAIGGAGVVKFAAGATGTVAPVESISSASPTLVITGISIALQ